MLPTIKHLYSGIINSGTSALKSYDPRLAICKGINILCFVISAINIVVGPIFYFSTGRISILIGSQVEALIVASLILLNYSKKYTLANIGFYSILNVATLYFGSILGRTAEAQLMIVFLVGLSLYLFKHKWIRILCMGASLLLLALMEINFKLQIIHSIKTTPLQGDLLRWVAYLVIMSLVIALFFLYARNISRLNVKLEEAYKKTEQNLEIKCRFIGNAYHEVNGQFHGLFTIIRILSKLNEEDKGKELNDMLNVMEKGCDNLQMILTNILEYSKYEAGFTQKILREPINLRVVMDGLVRIGNYSAREKGVDIQCKYAEDIPTHFMCDRIKFTQIITNLLQNAIKFTLNDSTIMIQIHMVGILMAIEIHDQGKGIPKEKLKLIFNPFVSERERGINEKGIGLGLPIVSQLVKALQGEIKVKSDLGKGSCFAVYLPNTAIIPQDTIASGQYKEVAV